MLALEPGERRLERRQQVEQRDVAEVDLPVRPAGSEGGGTLRGQMPWRTLSTSPRDWAASLIRRYSISRSTSSWRGSSSGSPSKRSGRGSSMRDLRWISKAAS